MLGVDQAISNRRDSKCVYTRGMRWRLTSGGGLFVLALLVVIGLVVRGAIPEEEPEGQEEQPKPLVSEHSAPGLSGKRAADQAHVEPPVIGGVIVRVVDRRGQPVIGADVVLYEGREKSVWNEALRGPAKTDANGEVSFLDLRVADVTSVVESPGAAQSYVWYGRAAHPPAVHEHRLKSATPLDGYVVDALTQGPLEGARVVALSGGAFGFHTSNTVRIHGERSSAHADATGHFLLPDFVSLFRVEAPGYATVWKQVTDRNQLSAHDVRVGLVRCSSLAGIVRDPGGRPLADVRVFASDTAIDTIQTDETTFYMRHSFRGHWTWGVGNTFGSDEDDPNRWWVEDIYGCRVATTNSEGHWQFDNLALGSRFRVWAEHSTYTSSRTQIVEVVRSGRHVTLELNPPTVIEVEVVLPNGKPVEEVQVDLTLDGVHRRVRAEGDRVRIEGAVPGTYDVDVFALGEGDAKDLKWTVEGGATVTKRVVVDRYDDPAKSKEIMLSGRLRSEDGTALQDALIELTSTGISTRSDRDGRFELPHCRGEYPQIRVLALGHRPLQKHDWSWNEGVPIDLRLDRIRRYLVSLGRAPVVSEDEYAQRPEVIHDRGAGGGQDRFVSSRVEVSKVVQVDLMAGDTRAVLHVPGQLPIFFDTVPEPGSVVQISVPEATGGDVLVQVERDGLPVEGATVFAYVDWSPVPIRASTDERGEVTIGPVPFDRDVTIDVVKRGLGAWRATRRFQGGDTVEVRLPRMATIAGQVLDSRKHPVPEVLVRGYRLTPSGEQFDAITRTDNSGRYRLVLQGGDYRIHFGDAKSAVVHRIHAASGSDATLHAVVKRSP